VCVCVCLILRFTFVNDDSSTYPIPGAWNRRCGSIVGATSENTIAVLPEGQKRDRIKSDNAYGIPMNRKQTQKRVPISVCPTTLVGICAEMSYCMCVCGYVYVIHFVYIYIGKVQDVLWKPKSLLFRCFSYCLLEAHIRSIMLY